MDPNYALYLSGILNQDDLEKSKGMDTKNYMFFSNLKTIKERVDKLLSLDQKTLDNLLEKGHDWASDHIATSKDDVEEVYNWIMSEMN
jgi:superfamily II helicase